jgi:hypothetical protein
MLDYGTKPAHSLYEPSAESLRLESQINRNIAKRTIRPKRYG